MFENNLKICRENLEMTQKELGFIFGVSDKTVSNWENGYDDIPLPKLVKFCNLYNYSIDYVLGLRKNNISNNENILLSKKDIGLALRSIRKELKLSQNKIADECSISRSTITYYELGKNLITTRNLYVICKKHNLSADDILRKK